MTDSSDEEPPKIYPFTGRLRTRSAGIVGNSDNVSAPVFGTPKKEPPFVEDLNLHIFQSLKDNVITLPSFSLSMGEIYTHGERNSQGGRMDTRASHTFADALVNVAEAEHELLKLMVWKQIYHEDASAIAEEIEKQKKVLNGLSLKAGIIDGVAVTQANFGSIERTADKFVRDNYPDFAKQERRR